MIDRIGIEGEPLAELVQSGSIWYIYGAKLGLSAIEGDEGIALTQMSLGAFLHITSFEPEAWVNQLTDIDRLAGVGHLEIWFEWLPGDRRELDSVKSVLAGRRTVVHAPFIGLSIASQWRDLRAISVSRIIECCRTAAVIGAELVSIHPGPVPVYEDRQSALDTVASSYEEIRHAAGITGVALENLFTGYGVCVNAASRLDDLIYISEMIADMKITLDIGHCVQNDEDYISFLSKNIDMVSNIHLHDATVGGRAHMRLGTGSVELGSFLDACLTSGYRGFIGLETLTAADTEASWQMIQSHLDGASEVST